MLGDGALAQVTLVVTHWSGVHVGRVLEESRPLIFLEEI